MTLARSSTAYNLVASALRREILSAELASGARVPAERELCLRFSASRITIRRALQILEEEMLIVRRQGSGTFVSTAPARKIPLLTSDFAGSVTRHAPELQRQLESWQWRQASPESAALLQTLPGARVLFARRVDSLGAEPVAYDELLLLGPAADRLSPADLAQVHFLQRWQQVQQMTLGHTHQAIEAVAADRLAARLLHVRGGCPLLKEIDVFHQQSAGPVGLFVSYYRHDMFRFTATVAVGPTQQPAAEAAGPSRASASRPRAVRSAPRAPAPRPAVAPLRRAARV